MEAQCVSFEVGAKFGKLTIDDRETTVVRSSYRQNLQLVRSVTCRRTVLQKFHAEQVTILAYREL
jgi:hypothetical protein